MPSSKHSPKNQHLQRKQQFSFLRDLQRTREIILGRGSQPGMTKACAREGADEPFSSGSALGRPGVAEGNFSLRFQRNLRLVFLSGERLNLLIAFGPLA
jgi:hypothetical protein